MQRIRLAVVGCGSVAERFYGPALQDIEGFNVVAAVDVRTDRAELVAGRFPACTPVADYRELAGRVDAAIVALPGHLNPSASEHLLRSGVSVLVEKPMASSVEEARGLAEAGQSGATLSVGFVRREAIGVRFAQRYIESGVLGKIRGFSIEDGYPFDWNSVEPFRFDRAKGGGILLDIGSHVLDTVSWWFGGCRVTTYRDDNGGGVDTNAWIEVITDSGIVGSIELSWTRTLRNTAIIVGDRGSLEVAWYKPDARISMGTGQPVFEGSILADGQVLVGAGSLSTMFRSQLMRWRQSLGRDGGGSCAGLANVHDGIANIGLINACWSMREPLGVPSRLQG